MFAGSLVMFVVSLPNSSAGFNDPKALLKAIA